MLLFVYIHQSTQSGKEPLAQRKELQSNFLLVFSCVKETSYSSGGQKYSNVPYGHYEPCNRYYSFS